MIYAPVVIPTLNRLEHLKRCLESLSHCSWADKTEVYIGLDYPPSTKYMEGYKDVCCYLNECGDLGFKHLTVIKREKNYGVVRNFRDLQVNTFKQYDRLIFCSDDVEFSPNFLQYMNMTLDYFENDDDVVAVTGYSYPIEWKTTAGATCLKQNINGSDWGLGIWRNTYQVMSDYLYKDRLPQSLKRVIKDKLYFRMIDPALINFFSNACYISYKKREIDYGRLPTDITIRCYIAVENKYVISPVISKLRNHGFDGSGAVCEAITGNFGNTALTYNYAEQPIDESNTFELKEDTLHDDQANRDILNVFDCRTPKQMKRTWRLIWLCEHVGCWAGKLYARTLQPFDIMKILYSRYMRTS